MNRVMFVCLGNICRSPMAKFMLRYEAQKKGIDNLFVDSAGTSNEEEGNPLYFGARQKLTQMQVPFDRHTAKQLRPDDYNKFDYFIAMDEANVRAMKRIFSNDPDNKVHRLLEYTPQNRDIQDPWYTGNFDKTYDDILLGIDYFLKILEKGEDNERL